MIVTTGGRGSSVASAETPTDDSLSASNASGSSSLAASGVWPSSPTMIIAVSWSSTWLIVTIWPSFISTLITSAALTDILCARSATVIVSGTAISRTTGSDGICTAAAPSSCRSCLRWPLGPRQPPAPPDTSPRVFSRRFFCCSSDQLDASLPDLISLTPGFFSSFFSPGLVSVLAAGLCSVPCAAASGAGATTGFFGAAIMLLIAATSSSTARRARACASAACFAASSASFCA